MIVRNELSIYGDRAVSELTTLRPCAERGGRMGRENPVGENVPEWVSLGQRLASRAQSLGRADFHCGGPGREPENLEN